MFPAVVPKIIIRWQRCSNWEVGYDHHFSMVVALVADCKPPIYSEDYVTRVVVLFYRIPNWNALAIQLGSIFNKLVYKLARICNVGLLAFQFVRKCYELSHISHNSYLPFHATNYFWLFKLFHFYQPSWRCPECIIYKRPHCNTILWMVTYFIWCPEKM